MDDLLTVRSAYLLHSLPFRNLHPDKLGILLASLAYCFCLDPSVLRGCTSSNHYGLHPDLWGSIDILFNVARGETRRNEKCGLTRRCSQPLAAC